MIRIDSLLLLACVFVPADARTPARVCGRVLGTTQTCCVTFSVTVDGFGSPATATGTAVANCAQGYICQTHWTGSVTKGS
jgi:hypothetical protein